MERSKRGGSYLFVGCVSDPSSKVVGACLFLGERSTVKGVRLVITLYYTRVEGEARPIT